MMDHEAEWSEERGCAGKMPSATTSPAAGYERSLPSPFLPFPSASASPACSWLNPGSGQTSLRTWRLRIGFIARAVISDQAVSTSAVHAPDSLTVEIYQPYIVTWLSWEAASRLPVMFLAVGHVHALSHWELELRPAGWQQRSYLAGCPRGCA